jgi:hypothetical protein
MHCHAVGRVRSRSTGARSTDHRISDFGLFEALSMYGISLTATDVASAVARSSNDSATQQIRIREGIERQVN